MKKILITSTDLMMIQFLVPHVKYLAQNGFHVELACSEVGGRMADVRDAVAGSARAIHILRLERSPVSPRNLLGYGDMKRLLRQNRYDVIWTNEPVMGVVTRLVANRYRKGGTKVVYMCHGFHFYKGSGKLNWLIYYPVERLMARLCDAVVTMNEEDYIRAQTFCAGKVHKIPGVGVDTQRFQKDMTLIQRLEKRQALGIPEDAWVVLSVGELTRRKNQTVVLKALQQLQDPLCRYVLCGKGDLREALQAQAEALGIGEQVLFLGYRKDVPEIYRIADCFAFPSLQEGLPFALMEAMESGLPIACSRIRGNVDLIEDGVGGILCDTDSGEQFCAAFKQLKTMDTEKMAQHNREKLKQYDVRCVEKTLLTLFEQLTARG